MLRFIQRYEGPEPASATLTLPYELRRRSRLHARLDSGEEVGLVLDRGRVLRDGDRLRSGCGRVAAVRAATEAVSRASAASGLILARACYHLGNRHLALQIGDGWVRYAADHVIDEMLRGLGLEVVEEHASFEPESGAYGEHHHHD